MLPPHLPPIHICPADIGAVADGWKVGVFQIPFGDNTSVMNASFVHTNFNMTHCQCGIYLSVNIIITIMAMIILVLVHPSRLHLPRCHVRGTCLLNFSTQHFTAIIIIITRPSAGMA